MAGGYGWPAAAKMALAFEGESENCGAEQLWLKLWAAATEKLAESRNTKQDWRLSWDYGESKRKWLAILAEEMQSLKETENDLGWRNAMAWNGLKWLW